MAQERYVTAPARRSRLELRSETPPPRTRREAKLAQYVAASRTQRTQHTQQSQQAQQAQQANSRAGKRAASATGGTRVFSTTPSAEPLPARPRNTAAGTQPLPTATAPSSRVARRREEAAANLAVRRRAQAEPQVSRSGRRAASAVPEAMERPEDSPRPGRRAARRLETSRAEARRAEGRRLETSPAESNLADNRRADTNLAELSRAESRRPETSPADIAPAGRIHPRGIATRRAVDREGEQERAVRRRERAEHLRAEQTRAAASRRSGRRAQIQNELDKAFAAVLSAETGPAAGADVPAPADPVADAPVAATVAAPATAAAPARRSRVGRPAAARVAAASAPQPAHTAEARTLASTPQPTQLQPSLRATQVAKATQPAVAKQTETNTRAVARTQTETATQVATRKQETTATRAATRAQTQATRAQTNTAQTTTRAQAVTATQAATSTQAATPTETAESRLAARVAKAAVKAAKAAHAPLESRASRLGLTRRRLMLVGTAAIAGIAFPAAMTFQGAASQPLTSSVVGPDSEEDLTTPASLTGARTAQVKSQVRAAAQESVPSCAVTSGASGTRTALAVPTSEIIVMPLESGVYRVSSPFGVRTDPITGGRSVHAGQDYAAPAGTPIHAVANGKVVHAGAGIEGRSNNLIIIEHEVGGVKFQSWYVHMYDDGVFVKEGDEVTVGQVIGAVGSNGYSTGPHLHLEIHDAHGELMDPAVFLAEHKAVPVEDLCK
ncbi:M23 family metallopeptidase [Actinobaculum suis]|uniref:M23 family metallopeptidase n=1 Tax=Actinobaculum suis TaxID=1657 RepID=UPI00066FC20D|nr:M23 family metallopeptidase [Actinobaculum suis]